MMAVPGHCLAQASREFLLLYPNARILVADETNFTKDKRHRFLSRAATATWDCIIITHSAFKFIPAPAEFERLLIQRQINGYSELLEKVDGNDRISRKRIESMKEKLEAKFEALQSRKDDLLTIGEIGIDQIIIDEAQEFRYAQMDIMCSSPWAGQSQHHPANAELHIRKLECLQKLHQRIWWPITGSTGLQRLETPKSTLLH
jgi:N12 class adenine-specific DNA methylase